MRLSLSRWKAVTNNGIGCVIVSCPNLRELLLRWYIGIMDLGLHLLAQKLTSLDVSYTMNVYHGRCTLRRAHELRRHAVASFSPRVGPPGPRPPEASVRGSETGGGASGGGERKGERWRVFSLGGRGRRGGRATDEQRGHNCFTLNQCLCSSSVS
ncbi:hypothetical protein C2845_PM13G25760 [Panicum miliaceum]|uniref:Uncharacterized protein n=1 Tax=Panicum miliaceum TaxID=4540 RepID=A0A3L6RHW0_PANMI|nr:hypothetical protein C2845_PM13G25760 [Panicum miliaceum]